jgi:ABC-type transport system substrate-binding protein
MRLLGPWPRVQRAVIKVVPEWGTRLAMFQAGDADIIAVPRAFVAQMDPLVQQGNARMYKDLPTNSTQDAFFNFKVEEKSPFVPLLGSDRKPELLSDIHMRQGVQLLLRHRHLYQRGVVGRGQEAPRADPLRLAGL